VQTLKLAELANGVDLLANDLGLEIRGIDVDFTLSALSNVRPETEHLLQVLPGLISVGAARSEDGRIVFGTEELGRLEDLEEDPIESLLPWSPYELRVNGEDTIGYENFLLRPRFHLRKKAVEIDRVGAVVTTHAGSRVRLTAAQLEVLQICSTFDALAPGEKTKQVALKALGSVQRLAASSAGISLDKYLAGERVVFADSVGIDFVEHADFATAVPKLANDAAKGEFQKQFLSFSEPQKVYDLKVPGSAGRTRVVIDDKLMPVLRSIKNNGMALKGANREAFLRNPRVLLPEEDLVDPDLVVIGDFSPRVKGIGFPETVKPMFNQSKQDWFGGIVCQYANGDSMTETFTGQEEAEKFLGAVRGALDKGERSVEWKGNSIPVNEDLFESVKRSVSVTEATSATEQEKNLVRTRVLLIEKNEDEIGFKAESVAPVDGAAWKLQTPASLKSSTRLKDHQVQGVTWMQGLNHFRYTRGALLADEMGLGKTLQILTLIAWHIEKTRSEGKAVEPALVIAPLGLLNVWESEAEKYFDDKGFAPVLVLHGEALRYIKKSMTPVKELEVGLPTLDLEEISSNSLVITNYDTVKNYQHSLGRIDWGVVVIDEAQEIKEPGTATTQAVKALKARFTLASTGTPVETSLINLWSVMDFVHPGNALGCLADFKHNFGDRPVDDRSLGGELRDLLGFNTSRGLVMRRTKAEVLKDLPAKTVVYHECFLTADERRLYKGVVEFVEREGGGQAALRGLQQLAALSQHPRLLERANRRMDVQSLCAESNKLDSLLEILRDVKRRDEKALVFVRTLRMQDILKLVLDSEFSLNTKIVNGSTFVKHKYVDQTRQGIIENFGSMPGFNVIILSPEVAGVGLTITAANHVVHYGRWWNPAKENQATDRAYRIGQDKPVYVHHLINKDPESEFETFDQKLDLLLRSREALAENFLVPDNFEAEAGKRLTDDLFGGNRRKSGPREISGSLGRLELEKIGPYELEALAALYMKGHYSRVGLTPKSGDGGVDVVCDGDGGICLVQCKHVGSGGVINLESASKEMSDSIDYYRETVFPKHLKTLPIRLLLFTDGVLDLATRQRAVWDSVEVFERADIESFLGQSPVSRFDLDLAEQSRVHRLSELFDLGGGSAGRRPDAPGSVPGGPLPLGSSAHVRADQNRP